MVINMRVLSIDYGDSRVGLAVSDIMGWTAQGIKTVPNHGIKKLIPELDSVIKEYMPEKIVIGLPKNMNATEGERAELTGEFREKLERRTGLPVVMWDERLTTVEAERTLIESKVRRENRKKYVDKIAAVFILQGYLDSLSMKVD